MGGIGVGIGCTGQQISHRTFDPLGCWLNSWEASEAILSDKSISCYRQETAPAHCFSPIRCVHVTSDFVI